MRRRPVLFLLPMILVAAMSGPLTASAAPDEPGPRDLKAIPGQVGPGQHQGHGPHGTGRRSPYDIAPPIAQAAAATCVNGMAGEYPCRNVDLLGHLPLPMMGGGNGSAGWGWVDPLTGKEYALVGRTNGTAFVDISNPTNPVYVGNLPSATGVSTWRELSVHNNHAYIVSDRNGAHGMQIFDLTRLRGVTSPPVTFTADARDTSFNNGHTIHIHNATGFAYVNGSNTCSGGSRVFNLANPTSPTLAACLNADGYTHDAQAVLYHGPDSRFQGREILVASNEDTVTVWDVSNKAAPQQLARKGYTGRGYTHQGWFTEDHKFFLLDDELDELNNGHATRTYVWNTADLTNPVLVGVWNGPTAATDHNQFVKGNFSYQATYKAGLRILDLTNIATPSAMTEAGFFDVDPATNANGFAGAWHVWPFYPSGNVVIFSIERGLFVVKPNLGGGPAPVTVYSDDFEAARGWTTNPDGTDTASTGQWERGDPEQTTSGSTVCQSGTTTSGSNDLVTARLAGSGVGANDVDGGTTSVRSPAIALPSGGRLALSFSWYLAHLNNATSADFVRVSVVHAGGTTTVFQQLGGATNRSAAWATATADLTPYAGQSVRIVVSAADAAGASLVEAAVDDVKIVQQP